jgi:hypothetical protein
LTSPKFSHRRHVGRSCVGFLSMTFAFSANPQVKTDTEVKQSLALQTVKMDSGEVVYVSGNDIVVRTFDGEFRHFPDVPNDKTVTVGGEELTVRDLKPGMKL